MKRLIGKSSSGSEVKFQVLSTQDDDEENVVEGRVESRRQVGANMASPAPTHHCAAEVDAEGEDCFVGTEMCPILLDAPAGGRREEVPPQRQGVGALNADADGDDVLVSSSSSSSDGTEKEEETPRRRGGFSSSSVGEGYRLGFDPSPDDDDDDDEEGSNDPEGFGVHHRQCGRNRHSRERLTRRIATLPRQMWNLAKAKLIRPSARRIGETAESWHMYNGGLTSSSAEDATPTSDEFPSTTAEELSANDEPTGDGARRGRRIYRRGADISRSQCHSRTRPRRSSLSEPSPPFAPTSPGGTHYQPYCVLMFQNITVAPNQSCTPTAVSTLAAAAHRGNVGSGNSSASKEQERSGIDDVSGFFECGALHVIASPFGGVAQTIAEALCGTINTEEGLIMLNQFPVQSEPYRLSVGYVSEDMTVMGDTTVEANLAFAVRMKMDTSYLRSRVRAVLTHLKLAQVAEKKVAELSPLHRKLVHIGMELVTNPCVLIVSNPSAGLSYYEYTELLKILRALAVDSRRVVVLAVASLPWMLLEASHSLVLVTREGRTVFSGPRDDCLKFLALFQERGPSSPLRHPRLSSTSSPSSALLAERSEAFSDTELSSGVTRASDTELRAGIRTIDGVGLQPSPLPVPVSQLEGGGSQGDGELASHWTGEENPMDLLELWEDDNAFAVASTDTDNAATLPMHEHTSYSPPPTTQADQTTPPTAVPPIAVETSVPRCPSPSALPPSSHPGRLGAPISSRVVQAFHESVYGLRLTEKLEKTHEAVAFGNRSSQWKLPYEPPLRPKASSRFILLAYRTLKRTLLRPEFLLSWCALFVVMLLSVLLSHRQHATQDGMQNKRGIIFFLFSCMVLVNGLFLQSEVDDFRVFIQLRRRKYFGTGSYLFVSVCRLLVPRLLFSLIATMFAQFLLKEGASLGLLLALTSFAHSLLLLCWVLWFRSVGRVMAAHLLYYGYSVMFCGFLLCPRSMPAFFSHLSILRAGYAATLANELRGQPFECDASPVHQQEAERTAASSSSSSMENYSSGLGSDNTNTNTTGGSSILFSGSSGGGGPLPDVTTSYCYGGDAYLAMQGFEADNTLVNSLWLLGLSVLLIIVIFVTLFIGRR